MIGTRGGVHVPGTAGVLARTPVAKKKRQPRRPRFQGNARFARATGVSPPHGLVVNWRERLSCYTVSTSTISESSSAVTFTISSFVIAAPSRASMRTPLTSMAPVAGTR